MVDWGEALRVGLLGFLSVFVVLGILSAVMSLISFLMYRYARQKKNQPR